MKGLNVHLIEIWLVEDNLRDIRLTREALKDAKILNRLHVVEDGETALNFLHRREQYVQAPCPDLILLDLNLPGTNGREVLADIKADEVLRARTVISCAFWRS